MATIEADAALDRPLSQAIVANFASASVVRVGDVIASAGTLLGQLSSAVRAAGSVAIAAGIAVLVGAIAAARRARTYDAVILKVLGATRRQVLGSLAIEYGLIALAVAGIALVIGVAGGWYVVTQVFELDWLPRWSPVLATIAGGAGITLGLSLAGSWSALGARPARALRNL
jgi:putative ABC transport system permease protein